MALPDFLIIGAMKCGTSTLAAQLGAQPGVFVTTPKEPEFFSDDAIHARGQAWYESLFAAAPPGARLGEASTGYTKLPTHPDAVARIRTLLPEVRLVYIIRNPLERLVSHYIHEWTMGVVGGSLSDALARHPELVDYGCYARQIAPYLDSFGPDRVLLLTLDEMRTDPEGVLARTHAFIGAPGTPGWQRELERVNASEDRFRRLPLQDLLLDNPVAQGLRRLLVPKAVRERVRRSRQMETRPSLTDADRAALVPVFARDRARLHTLFPGRSDIDRCYPFLAP